MGGCAGAKEVVCIVVRSLAIWFAQLFLFGKRQRRAQPPSPAATCRIAAQLLRDCELQVCAPSDKSNDCTCTGALLQ